MAHHEDDDLAVNTTQFLKEKEKERHPKMMLRHTHTLAILELPPHMFQEISRLLHEAGYEHAFDVRDGVMTIDMSGIGIQAQDQTSAHLVIDPSAQAIHANERNGEGMCAVCGRLTYHSLSCATYLRRNAPEPALSRDSADDDRPMANRRQVGGSHYGLGKIQHWDLAVMFGWDYLTGQTIKYLMRWRGKNGIQDLEKGQHYLEKLIETEKAKLPAKE